MNFKRWMEANSNLGQQASDLAEASNEFRTYRQQADDLDTYFWWKVCWVTYVLVFAVLVVIGLIGVMIWLIMKSIPKTPSSFSEQGGGVLSNSERLSFTESFGGDTVSRSLADVVGEDTTRSFTGRGPAGAFGALARREISTSFSEVYF